MRADPQESRAHTDKCLCLMPPEVRTNIAPRERCLCALRRSHLVAPVVLAWLVLACLHAAGVV